MGSAQDNKTRAHRNRRSGQDRRNDLSKTPGAGKRNIQVLLARLISVFIGALAGFLAAYALSVYFVQPLDALTSEAQEIVDSAVTDLEDATRQFNDARREFAPLEEELLRQGVIEESAHVAEPAAPSGASGSDSGDAAPVADVVEPEQLDDAAAAGSGQPGGSLDMAYYQQVRDDYLRLKRQRQRLTDQRDFWRGEIEKYQRDINLINLLGIAVVIVFALLGYLLYPLWLGALERLGRQLDRLTSGISGRATQATVGFFAGLIFAIVLILAVFSIFGGEQSLFGHGWFRLVFGAFMVVSLGLTGSLTGIAYFSPPQHDDPYASFRAPAAPKILDTSVIIDGRVLDIGTTGFLAGNLVITNSVLRELQSMADSADDRKRSKGRRGLELVRKMQDDPRLAIQVFDDADFDYQAKGTDEQLIIVAQEMDGMVVTNDYNLNRVAAIRNVRVININALANAVKTSHLPGDEIDIEIMNRGKQRGQGVGYLDDGTMVVIEDGEPYIGELKTIRITSVSQTVQGRLLFGRVDLVGGGRGNGEG